MKDHRSAVPPLKTQDYRAEEKNPRGLGYVKVHGAAQRKLINTLWISERVRFQNRTHSLLSVAETAPAAIDRERERRNDRESRKEKETGTFACIYIRGASGDLKRKESDDESGECSFEAIDATSFV